ncbi:sn-glycerol-1-phosphate dehydrogenase [Paenibacillus harenae]|uniref:sn-glycerol-1-phosphate dehydrogenase n=1 Tax=Paenibacillus harenae TaxID=306543 RepID=UPI0027913D75|nr:sn-glycerol-1-phosphate dehydrogenase [Paenibacillus harenae]MDQ0060332.1 glycerol-1-phosphate dehydrogenase [NAD(P)+] [Paenibacillus harenae]
MSLNEIRKAAARIVGFDPKTLDMGPVVLEAGALRQVAPYLKERGYKQVSIVADETTYEVAGRRLYDAIATEGISAHVTKITPNKQGDVIADEASVVQLMLDAKAKKAEVIVAVGSGTLHDIARFTAYTIGIPFLSVPTAPSVDGFNPKGAPLIIRGDKQTIQTIRPEAIFADLDVLVEAPPALVAAGFGDMLGKYTSLFDWKFGSITSGEVYEQVVADITMKALLDCVAHVDEIAERKEEGIRLLTAALLDSGFAMLVFGQSHSASGAEHHLSHFWETTFLREDRRQILHGAKVGVACAEISAYYRTIIGDVSAKLPAEQQDAVKLELAKVPDEAEIRRLLTKVGGPSQPSDLGIDSELLAAGLREAHRIRPNRSTMLKFYNDNR